MANQFDYSFLRSQLADGGVLVVSPRANAYAPSPLLEVLVDGKELGALVWLDLVPRGGVLLGPDDCKQVVTDWTCR